MHHSTEPEQSGCHQSCLHDCCRLKTCASGGCWRERDLQCVSESYSFRGVKHPSHTLDRVLPCSCLAVPPSWWSAYQDAPAKTEMRALLAPSEHTTLASERLFDYWLWLQSLRRWKGAFLQPVRQKTAVHMRRGGAQRASAQRRGLAVFHVRDDVVRVGDGRGAGLGAARRGSSLQENRVTAKARRGSLLGRIAGLLHDARAHVGSEGRVRIKSEDFRSTTGRWPRTWLCNG